MVISMGETKHLEEKQQTLSYKLTVTSPCHYDPKLGKFD